jgi:RHS repeat-associated protein
VTAANANYLIADRQGSVVATANTGGNWTKTYIYDPYGVPTAWGSIGTDPRFRYTGQAALPSGSLYYYKARLYDPTSGKFLQTDPVGYGPDVNLYTYVGNDPTDKADASGDCPECAGAILGGLLGGGLEAGAQYLEHGHITNVGAIVREAGIGAVAGAAGAGVGHLISKATEVAKLASIASKAASAAGAVAEGGVSGGVSAGMHGKDIVKGAVGGGIAGGAAKGVGALVSKATASGINAAEAAASKGVPRNLTASVIASGSLKMAPAVSRAGIPAAAGAASQKAVDVAHEAYDKSRDH